MSSPNAITLSEERPTPSFGLQFVHLFWLSHRSQTGGIIAEGSIASSYLPHPHPVAVSSWSTLDGVSVRGGTDGIILSGSLFSVFLLLPADGNSVHRSPAPLQVGCFSPRLPYNMRLRLPHDEFLYFIHQSLLALPVWLRPV